ncbi:Hypothetical predicted protein [Cloeon dipterum]|uniref:F-box domain-containing protein n=1 Tax=Cloeon dipterum TaxID=197152 RepID=A0A8S1CEX8_9INSE|nr:Hypothetical predicted protein [Cloeon dipterum]
MKKSMSNLQVFLYNASAEYHLRRLCMDHLPNLQVIEDFASEFCSMQDFIPFALDRISHETSNLRHLLVDFGQEETTSENVHLTHSLVSHLWVFWYEEWVRDESQWQPLLKFSNIESLSTARGVQMTFKEIFSACPRLEKLELATIINDPEPITFFARLMEIEIYFKSSYESKYELSNILSAPDLKKVTLFGNSAPAPNS